MNTASEYLEAIEAASISANNIEWGVVFCVAEPTAEPTSTGAEDDDGNNVKITQSMAQVGSYETALAVSADANARMWSDPEMVVRDPRSVLAFAFPFPLFYLEPLGFERVEVEGDQDGTREHEEVRPPEGDTGGDSGAREAGEEKVEVQE